MKLHFETKTDKITVKVHIEDDRTKLFLSVEPIGGPQTIQRQEILDLIKEAVNIEKVDVRVVDDVLAQIKKGDSVEYRRIIKGKPPKDGADGKLVLVKKKFDGDGEIKADKKGFVDYKELNLFDNITKGDVVGKIFPPDNGEDGLDVFEQALPAKPGKPVKVSTDKSVSVKPATDSKQPCEEIIAEVDGYLAEDAGKLAVKGEMVISGDLDLKYGNIDFIGSLKVAGDVVKGLTLKAKQGIIVQNSLTGASLISTDGDIEVRGFFYGGPESRVETSKRFIASVVQNLNAETGGDIIIAKEAVDCTFRTHASVVMTKGRLVGGDTSVTRGVEAKVIGNDVGQKTVIRLCSDIEITGEFLSLRKNIESHEKAIQLLNLHLGPFAKKPDSIQKLPMQARSRIEELFDKLKTVTGSIEKLVEKKTSMVEGAKTNEVMRVSFLSKLYRGVEVIAGESVFTPEQDLEGPASLEYIVAQKSFAVGEFKSLVSEAEPQTSKR